MLDAELAQPVAHREQLAVADREREVHVAPAAVAELLLARRPQPEPRLLAAAEPHAVAVVGQEREVEDLGVEARQAERIGRLQGQLAEAVRAHPPAYGAGGRRDHTGW